MENINIIVPLSVGVGIITCGNRKLNKPFIMSEPGILIYNDTERKGAASARNNLLKQMEGKDYIFIFDDDCWPVLPEWKYRIINWMIKNEVGYLAGLDYKSIDILRGYNDTIISASPYIGAFSVFSKKCIEKIGYYNTAYDRYGFEDVAYSRRAKEAGLCGSDKEGWASPVWINMYFHSADMFAENPPSVLTPEQKKNYIEKNGVVYQKEMTDLFNGKIYYGYK